MVLVDLVSHQWMDTGGGGDMEAGPHLSASAFLVCLCVPVHTRTHSLSFALVQFSYTHIHTHVYHVHNCSLTHTYTSSPVKRISTQELRSVSFRARLAWVQILMLPLAHPWVNYLTSCTSVLPSVKGHFNSTYYIEVFL